MERIKLESVHECTVHVKELNSKSVENHGTESTQLKKVEAE